MMSTEEREQQNFSDHIQLKERVQQLHKEQASINQINNTKQILELVELFGGIENVLSTYLHSNDVALSNHQLLRIQEMMTVPIPFQQKNKTKTLTKLKQDDNKMAEDGNFVRFTFNVNNSYLHSMFTEKNVTKMINIVFNRFYTLFVIASYFAMWALKRQYGRPWQYNMCSMIIRVFFWIIPMSICILSFNKVAFKLVINSFDFWIKVIYAIMLGGARCIYQRHQMELMGRDTYDVIFERGVGVICTIFIVIFVSSFDAQALLHIKWKVIMSIILAISFSFNSFSYEFLESDDVDLVIPIKATNTSFSMHSFLASCTRILAIFIWKQAFIIYRSKMQNKCVSIRVRPYIEWIGIHTNDKTSTETESNVPLDTNIVVTNGVDTKDIKRMDVENEENSNSVSHTCSHSEVSAEITDIDV
eukprot:765397_1